MFRKKLLSSSGKIKCIVSSKPDQDQVIIFVITFDEIPLYLSQFCCIIDFRNEHGTKSLFWDLLICYGKDEIRNRNIRKETFIFIFRDIMYEYVYVFRFF